MNPYSPPLATAASADDQKPALRELVIAWERLRLFYNALLAIPGILVLVAMVSETNTSPLGAVISGAIVAVCANLCFFLGPVAELYLRAIFRQGQPLGRGRWLIFGCGTLLSLFLVILTFVQLKTGWP